MVRKLMLILLSGVICLLWATSAFAVKYNEAPMLKTMVAAGELPPVEQRLPDKPVVVSPIEEIGQYGGTWDMAIIGPTSLYIYKMATYDPPLRFEVKKVGERFESKIAPNLFESWDVSSGGKVFTFKMRKGLKWSDGVPFTADDIMFWYEDVLLNDELSPSKPSWMVIGGEVGKVEKIDDYTVKFSFTEPHGLLLMNSDIVGPYFRFPTKHYLKQFHPKYTAMEKLQKMTKEQGFDYWYQLFAYKYDYYRNPDLPSLMPWKIKTPSETRLIYERNPYYWKVDPEGNQLPYIDRLALNVAESPEVVNLKAIAGELDMQFWFISLADWTLFMKNREKGDYRVLEWIPARGSDMALYPNLNVKDSVLRELIEDRRFRQALSLAINRDEVNEFAYLEMGKPRQATVINVSPLYKESYAKAYAEHNPKEANRLLDEIGLTKRDKDGYRLRPDGKTLSLTIESGAEISGETDIYDLIKTYWKDIGIKTDYRLRERSFFRERVTAGEVEIGVWEFGYAYNPITGPYFVVPYGTTTNWAPLYGDWYASGGKTGEKPTGDVLKVIELWKKIKITVDPDQQRKLMDEILRLHSENIWVIGLVGELPLPIIVKNDFRNVPETGLFDSVVGRYIGWAHPEQFFFRSR